MNKTGSRKTESPSGWVIKTYRHMNIPKSDFRGIKELFDEIHRRRSEDTKASTREKHPNRDITYGNYDRIQLVPVNSFSDFTNESSKTYNWYGSSQSILIFPLENGKSRRRFQWGINGNEREGIVIKDKDGKEIKARNTFFGASFCYISDEARSMIRSYEELMAHCNEAINRLVDTYNEVIKSGKDRKRHGTIIAEAFGSLSSAELIILWSAPQYTDILYLMDCLRDSYLQYDGHNDADDKKERKSLFRTTYTMISFPDVLSSKYRGGGLTAAEDKTLSGILGQAHIQFVMQNGVGEEQIKDFESFIRKCLRNSAKLIGDEHAEITLSLNRCAGEYDLIGYVDSKYVPRLFINPENLHDDTWSIEESGDESLYCSVHHPKYNEYVLYSFTRLSYRDTDLPELVNAGSLIDNEWDQKKKELACIDLSDAQSLVVGRYVARSQLLKKIQNEYKAQFQDLVGYIAQRVPATSNLIMELNQLFSDYVQCCSSCADYLWIEDYNELFLQVLERIKKSVLSINVWKECGHERSEGRKYKEEWKDARGRLEGINGLTRALHKQTGHISASNKLFFREQDIHFGYTAQHDLVLHAYYDIIKKLIGYIYAYSDYHFQSRLYPLVNFSAKDMISSKIYTEESAADFRNESGSKDPLLRELSPRVMVIHIPLDGMDNIMHYLPMLIHEVYHYASPKDRKMRNRILANIVTYQSLRLSFYHLVRHVCKADFKLEDEKTRKLVNEFTEFANNVFYTVVVNNSEAIYAGIKADFSDSDSTDDSLILRSWFVTWLTNWLNNAKQRDYDKWSDELHQSAYQNFCDLYHEVYLALKDALNREVKRRQKLADEKIDETEDTARGIKVFKKIVQYLEVELELIEHPDSKRIKTFDVSEFITMYVWNYTNKTSDLGYMLEALDEIFPDMAMVIQTQMRVSSYMLQTALDLDKQLYSGEQREFDKLRFGSVIKYLVGKRKNKEKEPDVEQLLEEELALFSKMYVASYRIAAKSFGGDDNDAQNRADKWGSIFMSMFMSCNNHSGIDAFDHIHIWVRELIDEMEECLTLSDNGLKKEQREYFVKPYQKYLTILQDDDLPRQQKAQFKLSIEVIQKFQNSDTLKNINERFQEQSRRHLSSITKKKNRYLPVPYSQPYEMVISTPDMYMSAVQYSLERLYRYREVEKIADSSGMWYRGVKNIAFPVLPSGYVHYVEDAARLQKGFPKVTDPLRYSDVQLHNYESFRYSAEGGNMDINPSKYYRTINYLTLMQHYSQHSNLLDWSEDYFGSSFFALEDEININDKYECERYKKENYSALNDMAVMYVLDPVRFNIACEEIENILGKNKNRNPGKNKNGMIIPNLSIEENLKNYEEYHDIYCSRPAGAPFTEIKKTGALGAPKNGGVEFSNLVKYLEEHPEFELELPRAIYAAKLNERIRAQSGLFVAFSLKAVPVMWEGTTIDITKPSASLFKYQALESIQEYYLTLPNKQPFMMKIKIPAIIKRELGRMLYKCGISKEKIYPELENYRHR